MEKTLSIIKPDGVLRNIVGEVIKRIENTGLKIVAMKLICLSKYQAENFYSIHKRKPFFASLTNFMSSGPSIVMVLQGKDAIKRYRTLIGDTNYKNAEKGTIRREFATDIEKNIVHGSDSLKTAAFEISYFFNAFEIVDS